VLITLGETNPLDLSVSVIISPLNEIAAQSFLALLFGRDSLALVESFHPLMPAYEVFLLEQNM
jgi:hypothetical protein